MIDVKDRIPTYPGRIKLVPVSGQANTYDMVRADEPIEPGTPINRALFQMFIDEVNAIRQQVDDRLFELSQRTTIGSLAVGSEFGLYENGVLVPFVKVSSGYNITETTTPTNRSYVVRKNCVTADLLRDSAETAYENCRTDRWLNNEYLSMLDPLTQSVIDSVDMEINRTSGKVIIGRKVFLLSKLEYGFRAVTNYGDQLPYFSTNERRIAMLNGTPVNHWTRDGGRQYITATGESANTSDVTMTAGIRPAFTLPSDFEVTVALPSTENVMATAEVN